MNNGRDVAKYISLCRKAIDREISLETFSLLYMELFKSENEKFDENTFEILNNIFLDADEYIPSSTEMHKNLKQQFSEFIIGDEEFIKRIKEAIKNLA